MNRSTTWMSIRVITETLLMYGGLMGVAIAMQSIEHPLASVARWLTLGGLGIWFNRFYLIGHEAVHRKLFPAHRGWNDAIGTLILLPIAAPLSIYRHIHTFHHAFNRQNSELAALDTFVVHQPLTPARVWYYRMVWFFYVFLGGFFLHTLISILLFLALPTERGKQLSPAFNGWTMAKRMRAWGEFGLAIAFHLTIAQLLGLVAWWMGMGAPLLVFAWVWSMMLYMYHYRTSMGDPVAHNVRSLSAPPLLAWVFLNFNEHSTHHANPNLPWYRLPQERVLPPDSTVNRSGISLWQAIAQQFQGPTLVPRQDEPQP